MVIVGLCPTCDFALFPKLKMKLKGRRFETASYITSRGNHKRYLTALRKITSMVLLKCGKNNGIAVYVCEETVLTAKIE
jgi:hypothetical protein